MTSIRAISADRSAFPAPIRLAPAQIAAYERDGFLFVPGLFTEREIALLRTRLDESQSGLDNKSFYVVDSTGGLAELIGWSGDRSDLLGGWVRVARLMESAQDLLEGRAVTHWHSKLSMKAPGSSGRWDWHQDYASWYREGCPEPAMLTATVALDPSDRENGCLKLLRGSHRMGRIDHPNVGEANAVDPVVLEEAIARLELVDCDLMPGDCVFFHGNTLHASGPNHSTRPRTLLHVSYNALDNRASRPEDWHPFVELSPLEDALLGDPSRWGPIDVDSLRRPERPENERGVYGYRVALKTPAVAGN